MSRVQRRWIDTTAVNHEKLDPSDSYEIAGLHDTGYLIVDGTSRFGLDSTFLSNVSVQGDAHITGDASIQDNLSVLNDASFLNKIYVYSDARIGGNALISGDGSIGQTLFVSSDASIGGILRTSGDETIGRNLLVLGDSSFVGDVVFYMGDTTVHGNLYVDGTAFIGRSTIRIDASNIASSGNLHFGSNDILSRAVLDTSGHIGVGTTIPHAKVELYEPSTLGAVDSLVLKNDYDPAGVSPIYGNRILFKTGVTDVGYPDRGGKIEYYSTGSYSVGTSRFLRLAASINTPDLGMTISGMGDVGIGTSGPAYKMHVYSSTASTVGMAVQNTSNPYSLINVGVTSDGTGRVITGNQLLMSSGLDMVFATVPGGVDTERMRILGSTGQVGIGTTNPVYTLHVHRDTYPTIGVQKSTFTDGDYYSAVELSQQSLSNYNAWLNISVYNPMWNGSSTYANTIFPLRKTTSIMSYADRLIVSSYSDAPIYFLQDVYGSTKYTMTLSSGSVGIGKTNPASMLHIYGADPVIRLEDSDSIGNDVLLQNGSGAGYLRTIGAFPLTFRTTDTDRMIITAGGKIGVGTTNPSYALDVWDSTACAIRCRSSDGQYSAFTDHHYVQGGLNYRAIIGVTGYYSWLTSDVYGGGCVISGMAPYGGSSIYLATGNGYSLTDSTTRLSISGRGAFSEAWKKACVGIGTTIAWDNLQIGKATFMGDASSSFGVSYLSFISNNAYRTLEEDPVRYGHPKYYNKLGKPGALLEMGSEDSGSYTNFIFSSVRFDIYQELVRIKEQSGNIAYVGIGTSSPARNLHIYDPRLVTVEATVQNGVSFASTTMGVLYDGDSYIWAGSRAGNRLHFGFESDSAHYMVVKQGAGVGIGTTNPAYGLDVNGNARVTGTLTAGALSYGSFSVGTLTVTSSASIASLSVTSAASIATTLAVGTSLSVTKDSTVVGRTCFGAPPYSTIQQSSGTTRGLAIYTDSSMERVRMFMDSTNFRFGIGVRNTSSAVEYPPTDTLHVIRNNQGGSPNGTKWQSSRFTYVDTSTSNDVYIAHSDSTYTPRTNWIYTSNSGHLNLGAGTYVNTLCIGDGTDTTSTNGFVGIGTDPNNVYRLKVVGDTRVYGAFAATSKSFEIDHPDRSGWTLRHGSIESPEYGLVYRGKTSLIDGTSTICMPSYFRSLADESSATISLTCKGSWSPLYVESFADSTLIVSKGDGGSSSQEFYWLLQTKRKDIPDLIPEYPTP